MVLTKEKMEEWGFKYQPPGIQGADMWQGLGYWQKQINNEWITFRGDKNLKYQLRLAGYFNSHFEFEDQIVEIVKLITGEDLTKNIKL